MTTPIGSQTWELAKDILAGALALPESARAAYVASRTSANTELAEEVQSLLAQATGIEHYIEDGASLRHTPAEEQERRDLVGRPIGAYTLGARIGAGGMGVVYAAKRSDGAYDQSVAIKLLRVGNTSDRAARSLAQERQSLALLDHPNIARLLDGGETEDGTPYIVMELVNGVTIDRYCQANALSVRARISLVQGVCEAVQSAHQRLLIHRDVKPSNVLVTADGQPKLLDFGIARLLESTDAQATAGTHQQFSPRYASPEQVRGNPVTVATDVYGLGLLLYELLTRNSPYARISSTTGSSPMDAMQAILQDPARRASEVARANSSADASEIQGDLDTILAKACAKEPGERYPTVAALNEDLHRWMTGLPILARPQTIPYRVHKFVMRHRWAVVAASLGSIAVAVGAVGTYVQKERAERRLEQVREISTKLIFNYYDRIESLPGSKPVQLALMQDATKYLDALALDAGDDAAFAVELGTGYRKLAHSLFNGRNLPHLGDRPASDALMQKSRLFLDRALSARPQDSTAKVEMSRWFAEHGATLGFDRKTDDAIAAYRSGITHLEAVLARSPAHRDALFQLPQMHLGAAEASTQGGRSSDASIIAARAAVDRFAASAKEDAEVENLRLFVVRKQFTNAMATKKFAEAIEYVDEEISGYQRYLKGQPDNFIYSRHLQTALSNKGAVLNTMARYAEALAPLDATIDLATKMLSTEAQSLVTQQGRARSYYHRARARAATGNADGAYADWRASVEDYRSLGTKALIGGVRRQHLESIVGLAREAQKRRDSAALSYVKRETAALLTIAPALSESPPTADWLKELASLTGYVR